MLSISVIGWIIAALLVFNNRVPITAKIGVGILAVSSFFGGAFLLCLAHKNDEQLFGNIGTTIVSIAVTVIVLARLNERRRLEERKQEIFEEIESPVRDVAVEAVRLVRKYGWLDEALKKVNFERTQLVGVDFRTAHIGKADLSKANLQEADLMGANLQGANLAGANLEEADLLAANLQEVKYDDNTVWPEGFDPIVVGAKLESVQ